MFRILFKTFVFFLFLISLFIQTFSQTPVCKARVFTALRPIPKLKYRCRQSVNDYDEQILKFPERVSAVRSYTRALENFTNASWWASTVKDLNFCFFRNKPGVFNKSEKERFDNGDYVYRLFGNNQLRVVSVTDPCYQTGFSGADLFLLYRKNGKVYAAEIVDGFFSRADNPISVNFAMNGNEQIIEINSASGGLYATGRNYYFTIDPKTNRAIPKNLFRDDAGKLTNQIDSMELLGESEEYGLPPNIESLEIIKKNRLAKSFYVFKDTAETIGEDKHQKFEKVTFRWNGKFYQAIK